MAKTKVPTLQKQLEEIKKRAKSASTPADSASRQLSNYQTRIKASGVDPESITDKRNFLEKKLNLPENQMFILDALELLGRPYNALMSGADALASGADAKNAGGAFMDGLSGKEYKELKDVLKTVTKSDLGDKPGSFEAIDLVNLAGGIFLDPIDWALIPATGGAKVVGDVAQAGKIGMSQLADGIKVADAIKDGVKLTDKGLEAARIASEAADAAKAAKATKPAMKSVSDLVFQGAYKGIGKTAKFGDELLEGTLKLFGGDELAGLYKGAKKQVTRAFKEGGREFKGMLRYADNQIIQLRNSLGPLTQKLDNIVATTSEALKQDPEVIKKVLYDMLDFTGDMAGKPVKLSRIIEEMLQDRKVYANAISTRMIPYTDETWAAIRNAFTSKEILGPDDFMRHVQIGNRKYIKFDDAILDESGVNKLQEALRKGYINGDADVLVGRMYSPAERASLEAYMSNPTLKAALKEVQGVMDETETLISSISGFSKRALSRWSKSNDWRITHVLNNKLSAEDMDKLVKLGFAYGGNSKVIRNRTFNMSALEANRLMHDAYMLAAKEGKLSAFDETTQLLLQDYLSTDMFVRDLKQGFDAYSGAQAKSLIRNKTLAEILLQASNNAFDDPQVITDLSKGVDLKRFIVFREDEARVVGAKLAKINEIYKSPALENLVKRLRSGDVAINKYLYGMLNRVVDVDANAMITLLGKFNALYKTGKTLSPMFNIVNLTGNVFNMAMAGMKLQDIGVYLTKAHGVISQKDDILRKVAQMGINSLTEDEKSAYAVIRKFIDQGIFGMDGSMMPTEFTRALRGAEDIAGGTKQAEQGYRYTMVESINQIDQKEGIFEELYGHSLDDLQKGFEAELAETTTDTKELLDLIRAEKAEAKALAKAKPVTKIKLGEPSQTLKNQDLRYLVEDLSGWFEDLFPKGKLTPTRNERLKSYLLKGADIVDETKDELLSGVKIDKKFTETVNKILNAIDDPTDFSDEAFNTLKKLDAEYGTRFTQHEIFDNRQAASRFYSNKEMAAHMDELWFKKDNRDYKTFNEVLHNLYEVDKRAQIKFTYKGKKRLSMGEVVNMLKSEHHQDSRQVAAVIENWNRDVAQKGSKLSKMKRSDRYKELSDRLNALYKENPGFPKIEALGQDAAYINDLETIRKLHKAGDAEQALKLFRKKFPDFEISLKSLDTLEANQAKAAKRLRTRSLQEFTPAESQKYKSILEVENASAMQTFEEAKKAEPGRYDKLTRKQIYEQFADRAGSEAYLKEHSSVKKALAKRQAQKKIIKNMSEKERDAILGNDVEGLLEILAKGMKKPKQVVDKLVKGNLTVNQTVDQYMRMAMYLHGLDNPDFVARLGVNTPMEAVRLALFDPNDLSYFEDHVLKKLIPFYTFTKKNLVYQMENLSRHSAKYHRLYKGVRMLWNESGVDWASLPEYQQNQMFIPIPGIDADGNYNYIRANLPFADAIDFAQDPLRKTLSSLTPAVRAPFELATNTQIFTGMPIEKFQGQKGATIPFLDAKSQYALSQTGWDVPTRTALQFVDNMNKGLRGEIGLGQMVGQGINLTRQGNIQRNVDNAIYEDLDAIKEYVAKLKQAGTTLPTVDEAYGQNQVVNDLKAKLAKYTGIPK